MLSMPRRFWMYAVLALFSCAANAQTTPVGLWRTVDDSSGKTKALIRIFERYGALWGRIEKILERDPAWNGLCDRCRDDRKDQPVEGMVILTNLKQQGTEYSGGEILDPESGTVYRCRVKIIDSGKALEVRGYIGTPLFGRTQVWLREK